MQCLGVVSFHYVCNLVIIQHVLLDTQSKARRNICSYFSQFQYYFRELLFL